MANELYCRHLLGVSSTEHKISASASALVKIQEILVSQPNGLVHIVLQRVTYEFDSILVLQTSSAINYFTFFKILKVASFEAFCEQ